jgi:hypothetical protein
MGVDLVGLLAMRVFPVDKTPLADTREIGVELRFRDQESVVLLYLRWYRLHDIQEGKWNDFLVSVSATQFQGRTPKLPRLKLTHEAAELSE